MRPRLASLVLAPALVLGVLALPALAQAASSTPVPPSFSFSGAGWGHGVGMSQVGAYGQAAAGRSANQILTHYYTGSTVGAVDDSMDLRVSLAYQQPRVRMRAEALGTGSASLEVTVGSTVVKVPARTIVEVSASSGKVAVSVGGQRRATGSQAIVRWSGTRSPGGTGSAPAVLNLVKGSQSLDTSGHRYRYGRVEVLARGTGSATTVAAVNVVRLHDEYLYGIGEMPSSWPAAALQAQVIAARGYALTKYRQGLRSGCSCHVFSDTSDQVFVGWSKQSGPSGDRWTAAVKATHLTSRTSKAVLVKGVPAQTFYFSSSGGRTQNSEDVWSSALSYLRSVDDRWSLDPRFNPTNAAWGPRVRSQAQVASAFGLSDVARIDLSTRYASGAVRLAKAWSSRGEYAAIAGTSLLSRLSLTSRWYWLTGQTNPVAGASSSAYTITISDTTVSARVGSTTTITGRVSPADSAAGRNVSLKRWDAPNKRWTHAASARVTTTGRFTFTVGGDRAQLRTYTVYKPTDSCGAGCVVRGVTSRKVSAAIVAPFSVAAATSPWTVVENGDRIRVKGKVSPAAVAAGSSVSIKAKDAGGIWRTVATTSVDREGRFLTDLRSLATGRQQLAVYKARGACSSGVCAYASATSRALDVVVQEPFTVAAATEEIGRRDAIVRGKVSPASAAAGDKVVVQRWLAGRWVDLGLAWVGRDGRFARAYTGLPMRTHTVRVVKGGEGCAGDVCVRPGAVSPERSVALG